MQGELRCENISYDMCYKQFNNIFRECIHLIKRKNYKKNPQISQYVSDLICREHSDTEVYFDISDRYLELKECSMNFILVKHDIPQISFVCGGDEVNYCWHKCFKNIQHVVFQAH